MKAKWMIAPLMIVMVAALGLAQAGLVVAKGPPQKVTISSPDMPQEIDITGSQPVLDALAMMTLEDYQTLSSDAPEGIANYGYLITRFYEDSVAAVFPLRSSSLLPRS